MNPADNGGFDTLLGQSEVITIINLRVNSKARRIDSSGVYFSVDSTIRPGRRAVFVDTSRRP